MNKFSIVKNIAKEFSINEYEAAEFFDNVFGVLISALVNGKNVNIYEFGKFTINKSKIYFSPVKRFSEELNYNYNNLSAVRIRAYSDDELKSKYDARVQRYKDKRTAGTEQELHYPIPEKIPEYLNKIGEEITAKKTDTGIAVVESPDSEEIIEKIGTVDELIEEKYAGEEKDREEVTREEIIEKDIETEVIAEKKETETEIKEISKEETETPDEDIIEEIIKIEDEPVWYPVTEDFSPFDVPVEYKSNGELEKFFQQIDEKEQKPEEKKDEIISEESVTEISIGEDLEEPKKWEKIIPDFHAFLKKRKSFAPKEYAKEDVIPVEKKEEEITPVVEKAEEKIIPVEEEVEEKIIPIEEKVEEEIIPAVEKVEDEIVSVEEKIEEIPQVIEEEKAELPPVIQEAGVDVPSVVEPEIEEPPVEKLSHEKEIDQLIKEREKIIKQAEEDLRYKLDEDIKVVFSEPERTDNIENIIPVIESKKPDINKVDDRELDDLIEQRLKTILEVEEKNLKEFDEEIKKLDLHKESLPPSETGLEKTEIEIKKETDDIIEEKRISFEKEILLSPPLEITPPVIPVTPPEEPVMKKITEEVKPEQDVTIPIPEIQKIEEVTPPPEQISVPEIIPKDVSSLDEYIPEELKALEIEKKEPEKSDIEKDIENISRIKESLIEEKPDDFPEPDFQIPEAKTVEAEEIPPPVVIPDELKDLHNEIIQTQTFRQEVETEKPEPKSFDDVFIKDTGIVYAQSPIPDNSKIENGAYKEFDEVLKRWEEPEWRKSKDKTPLSYEVPKQGISKLLVIFIIFAVLAALFIVYIKFFTK
jgi:hypothetical protein